MGVPEATDLRSRNRSGSRKFQAPQARSGYAKSICKGGADGGAVRRLWLDCCRKKQGTAGITTAAPYVAGQWGRGETGYRNDAQAPESFRFPRYFFRIFFATRLIDFDTLNPSPPVAF